MNKLWLGDVKRILTVNWDIQNFTLWLQPSVWTKLMIHVLFDVGEMQKIIQTVEEITANKL